MKNIKHKAFTFITLFINNLQKIINALYMIKICYVLKIILTVLKPLK